MSAEEHFTKKLKAFLHDPIDKCLDIPNHEARAESYANLINVFSVRDTKGPDMIASCMERSLLPPKITQAFNEIRHPLSDGFLKVSDIDPSAVFNSIKDTYSQIGDQIHSWDDKKKFFYLWRNLQDLIFEKAKNESWAKYLPILPADTRVPDHSIWEHLKIASSILAVFDDISKTLIQNNSLFLFSIGPVQSFIAQARKTQDFYMGSFILSFLTFKAMEVIIDKFGPTNIIYPDLYKQPLVDWFIKKNFIFELYGFREEDIKLPTIPNRFVAILPLSNEGEINNIVEQMKKEITESIQEAKKTIFSKFKLESHISDKIRNKIDSQLSEFPEIYWVALPWRINDRDISSSDFKNILDDNILKKYEDLWDFATKDGEYEPNIGLLYELIYSALERFMGSRKNVRTFKQPETEEKGRKCSVCGERDVIFFRESINKNKFTRYNNLVVDLTDKKDIPLKFIADGEGLCALCFLKRTFEIYLKEKVSNVFVNLTFPSTDEIACSDFKEKMLLNAKNEYQEYLEKFRSLLGDQFTQPLDKLKDLFVNLGNLEGTWFYMENLTEKYIKDELGTRIEPSKIEELKNSLKKIIDKVGKPNSYYALIYLDGDNMGKWLAGELLPDIEYSYASETWENLPNNFKNKIKAISPRKLLTPAIHASISTALRNYALEFVKRIVEEEHLGKLVYAGGDDVLAFVNLKDLLDVIHKLRWAFSGNIKINSKDEIEVELNNNSGFVENVEKDEKGNEYRRYLLTMGPKASASMGIVIAHYKTPLQIVIKKAFEMEKIAKEDEKNSLAICLLRRSGEERIATAKWAYIRNGSIEDTINTLKDIVYAFDEENENGYIAKGFIKKINDSISNLKNNGKFIATSKIFESELSRLLYRSFNQPKGKKIEKDERKKFIEKVYEKMNNLFWDTGENLDNFINFCIISTFILKSEE